MTKEVVLIWSKEDVTFNSKILLNVSTGMHWNFFFDQYLQGLEFFPASLLLGALNILIKADSFLLQADRYVLGMDTNQSFLGSNTEIQEKYSKYLLAFTFTL